MKYITPEQYEKAAKNGISGSILDIRVKRQGWSMKRAITTPLKQWKRTNPWLQIARANGISDVAYYARTYQHGWSEEKAATQPLRNKGAI